MIEEKKVGWLINSPDSGPTQRLDEVKMRSHAVIRNIPITTTIDGMKAAVNGLQALRKAQAVEVCSIQEFHRHSPKLKLNAARPAGRKTVGAARKKA
jgi:carbamoyl-phosphate synthase large subunit